MTPEARRRLILLMAIVIAGSVLGMIRFLLEMEISGRVDYTWIYGIIAVDVIILGALAVYSRSRELQVGDLQQRLAARTKEQGSTRGGWILAVFDNGLVMQAQRQGALVSLYLCYGPDLHRYAPTLAEIQAYMRGTGVMRRVQLVTKRKGDPAAQASLEQVRQQLGPRWMILELAKRRPDKRPTVTSPSWLVGVSCYWSKWFQDPHAFLSGIDIVEGLLDSAQRQYFAQAMAAG